ALREVRCPLQPDRAVEDAVAGRGDRGIPEPSRQARVARSQCQGYAGEDRAAGIGKRFFGRRARSYRRCERKEMIDPGHGLPLVRQAELLELSRSNVYYLPRPVCEVDLGLMRH